MKYYIADTHFGDPRIIKLCNRPFKTMDEMINTIRFNWNSVVDPKDDVYVLGDVAYCYRGNFKELMDSLNGRKHLLIGNHDSGWMKNKDNLMAFHTVDKLSRITDDGKKVVLCHYPLMAFEGSLNGGHHVYGHIHNNYHEPMFEEYKKITNTYNAGVDVNNFQPVSLDQLISVKRRII